VEPTATPPPIAPAFPFCLPHIPKQQSLLLHFVHIAKALIADLLPLAAAQYIFAKRLASTLSIPLTLHGSLAPAFVKKKPTDAGAHQGDGAPAEVGLAACVVIGMKMVYGLDGEGRWV